MHIVYIAVAIIVDAIPGDLFGIGPKDVFKVFVQCVYAESMTATITVLLFNFFCLANS